MATKEMERKALAQIKKIVEGLGDDSYIGMAFEGCFEIAEENIQNDWGCSLKQEIEEQRKLLVAWDEKCKGLVVINENLKQKYEEAEQTIKQQNEQFRMVRDQMNKYKTELNDATDKIDEFQKENDVLADEIKCMEADYEEQIMKLKAKLYDLMVK